MWKDLPYPRDYRVPRYFFPESFRRYLMSAAMIKMMTIQMAICIVVTFCRLYRNSFYPLGTDSVTLALRQCSYTSAGHSA